MRPERRKSGRPFRGPTVPEDRTLLPFETIDDDAAAAAAQVGRRLTDAGRRARAELGEAERPDPTFASALRERLLLQLPPETATEPVAATVDRTVPGWVVAPAAGTTSRRTRGIVPTAPSDLPIGIVGFAPTEPMPDHGRPQRVVGRLAWTGPRFATPPRWAAAMVAAVLIVAAIGLGPGRSLLAGPAPSRVTDAVGAALLRAGTEIALVDGAELHSGDEVRVAAGGHATLVLGGSLARLDGGADVIVRTLAADRIGLDQQAGRVYHRVSVPASGSYTVSTAGFTWTAHGTAFDLDRHLAASGDTSLTLLAIQHDVVVDGPGISATIAEGRRAEIVLSASSIAPDLTTGAPTVGQLHDPWLAANAALDAAAGFDPGILALLATEPPPTSAPTVSPEPTMVGPTTAPSIDPNASPDPSSPPATSTPSPTDTARPAPKQTPAPTPTPAPKPIAALGLIVKACPGGTLLDWSTAPAAGFHHYKSSWSGSASFTGATIVDGSGTTNRSATSAVDAGPSDPRWYRTYAYDAGGHIVARSPIREATGLGAPADLGTLAIGPDGPNTAFSWPDMSVPAGCYGFTKLVYSVGAEPSYGEPGSALLWWTADRAIHQLASEPTPSGTWWFRVQVIVETDLGRLVVAQTAPVQYLVP